MRSVMWFRRDLRVHDNEALSAACSEKECVPLFVLDPIFLERSGLPRLTFLFDALKALNESLGGSLVIRIGSPVEVVPAFAAEVKAQTVFVSKDFAPYGRKRDIEVAAALRSGGMALRGVGSPYCVEPGTVRKDDGNPYAVFTPFSKRWAGHLRPHEESDAVFSSVIPAGVVPTTALPTLPECTAVLPVATEKAAHDRWSWFITEAAGSYSEQRNLPAVDGSSQLSAYLRFGLVHPQQLITDLGDSPSHLVYRSELAWREFYADVLFHQPHTAWNNLQSKMDKISVDTDALAKERFAAWCTGQTGYPIVDAGMRQLLATGWMHNRVRMIVASFLVKDLHLPWQWGAQHFMKHLVDGDIASNNHGWQWSAGSGTDAAPYFRIFNPQSQSEKFDPTGAYIRKYVDELSDLEGKTIHVPGADGRATYAAPMVNHSAEREESLSRYKAVSGK